jgi:predicted RNA-binding Zn ribbon-like protein
MSWEFDAGNLALDLVNTLEWRGTQEPSESLHRYSDLIDWALQGGIIGSSEAKLMSSSQNRFPDRAEKAIFSSITSGGQPSQADLVILNRILASSMAHSKLEWHEDRFQWVWQFEKNIFDRIVWPVAQSAVDLLTKSRLNRVGECADDRGCAYLFIDTTRNHSRKKLGSIMSGRGLKAEE